jgi:hypothetical protein
MIALSIYLRFFDNGEFYSSVGNQMFVHLGNLHGIRIGHRFSASGYYPFARMDPIYNLS